ncbi:MAG: DNA-binding protein [Flavobacteriales bacterium]|nr:DNA-binding protein [Flavobacteriales bacterium]
MGNLLYTHDKNDLEKIVRMVVSEIRKTESFNSEANIPEDDRLTQKQAAAFYGKSIPTLIKYRKKYNIPYYQMGEGTFVFYSKKELLEAARKNPQIANSRK